MLPSGTVPVCLLQVLQVCRGVFTGPSFVTFTVLVTGGLSGVGPRTVTGMWSAAGMAGWVHWLRAHRFFSHARWDVDALGLVLARLAVQLFVGDGQPLTVAVDDTLFHRYRKVFGVFWQHDGSAKGRDGLGCGNCFVAAGLVVRVPFATRSVALPVLFRLHRPKQTASKPEQARELIEVIAAAFPGRRVHVVADNAQSWSRATTVGRSRR
jgi:hypothetical protein